MTKITKAVFPVAGLGTRFLPATKASPKEMLPIVDKPIIQYAVDEAIAAGIKELIFVTSSTKGAIEDHFDSHYELETRLQATGKQHLLDLVKQILPKGINCVYTRQPEALGLGHAVLCARPLINNEPFAVLLADDLIDAKTPCLKQMVEAYQEHQASIVAVQEIDMSQTEKYGVVDITKKNGRLNPISKIVEKPKPAEAPSNLGVVGRYILSPQILDYLAQTPSDKSNEIQLTDAIAALMQSEPVYAWQFEGTRYDCGSKLGYLEATLTFALKHPEVGTQFAEFLRKFSF